MYNTLQPSTFYKIGLYIRLSQEDEDKIHKRESESESIQNQRSLLLNYLKSNGFILTKEYVDDGYSGTNFDRPAFKEMINDIENCKINCVITKDLSRLGRDYIKCGYYIEQYFPLKKVRYISILDNVDTFLDSANNDIAPFKALFNDMTSKDTSKKIRSILKNKKIEGKFIGSKPSFGYKKDPIDKGHLIPDLNTAPIVKRIFDEVAKGDKISDIVDRLNEEKIPTPSSYKNIKKSTRQVNGDIWTSSSINKILKILLTALGLYLSIKNISINLVFLKYRVIMHFLSSNLPRTVSISTIFALGYSFKYFCISLRVLPVLTILSNLTIGCSFVLFLGL